MKSLMICTAHPVLFGW